MKKFLLSVLSVAAMSFAANADTTIDFTALDVWAPEGTALANVPMSSAAMSADVSTVTVSEVEIGFMNCYVMNSVDKDTQKITKVSGLYIAGGKTPKGEITFKLPFDCASFTATTTSGCSTNADNKVIVYAGANKISGDNPMAFNKTNNDYVFTLTGDEQKAGTVYKIAAGGSKNPQIAKIVFKAATSDPSLTANVTEVSLFTVKDGEATATVSVVAANVTGDITPSADVAGITFGKATYTQAEAAEGIVVKYTGTTAGQHDGTITFAVGETKAEVAANCYTAAQAGTKADPLSVNEVLTLKSRCAGKYWVKGIINDKTASNGSNGIIGEAATAANGNIILKDEEGNKIPVALPSGDVRTALNIVDNPANIGKTVSVFGSLTDYYSVPGVKDVTEYEFAPAAGKKAPELSFETKAVTILQGETYAGQTVTNPNNLTGITYASDDENIAEVDAATGAVTIGTETGTVKITASFAGNDEYDEGSASYTITVAAVVNSLAEFNALNASEEAVINCELTVTYSDAQNAYVTDGTDYQMLYKYGATYSYKVGDVLDKGWKAKNVLYKGHQPEMEFVGDVPTVKEAGTFTPTEIAVADLKAENINRVCVLKDVEFAEATLASGSFKGKVGETEITFYNKFKIASAEAGKYDVTGIVSVNTSTADAGAIQFLPISYEVASGIDSITADDAAEAEYYNLQGVRVAAPESGLYIVRRGNKVTKELVK